MPKYLEKGVLGTDLSLSSVDDLACVAAWVEGDLWQSAFKKTKQILAWASGAIGASLILLILSTMYRAWTVAALIVVVAASVCGVAFFFAARIRPAARVTSVSKIYWGTLALPLEGKAVLYDLAGVFPEQKMWLPRLEDSEGLFRLARQLQDLPDDLEIFEPPEPALRLEGRTLYGVDREIAQLYIALRANLQNSTAQVVCVPALEGKDPAILGIVKLLSKMREGDPSPILMGRSESLAGANANVEGLYKKGDSQEYRDIDDVMSTLAKDTQAVLDRLQAAHAASLALIRATHDLATHTTSSPAVSCYCPFCNQPGQAGHAAVSRETRLAYDVARAVLYCPVCQAIVPDECSIILTRFSDEVFYPVFDQILLSMRDRILEIENDIENQLLQMRKEKSVKVHEAQMSLDRERRKRVAQVRQYKSRAASLEVQVTGMTALLALYQKIEADVQRRFDVDAQRLREEAARQCRQVEEQVEHQYQRLDALANAESERRAQINREESERRHRELLAAQQQIAGTLEKQLRFSMMTPEQKDDMRHGSFLDSVNPAKQFRVWRANCAARSSAANLE